MLQEDNGDNFEIIDKKTEGMAESVSSLSSSISLLQSPPSIPTMPAGNLLSNVAPPSSLPNFLASPVPPAIATVNMGPSTTNIQQPLGPPPPNPASYAGLPPPATQQVGLSKHIAPQHIQTIPSYQLPPQAASLPFTPGGAAVQSQGENEPFYPTTFSAAIPPTLQPPLTATPVISNIPEADASGGFMGWMKGAVSSGGILSKVAEKAKNSMDSMITTLDPQMREHIYAGGDVAILVASQQEAKISAVREAFQSVFGKATVEGIISQASNIAVQPVGFAAGVKAAEERIQGVLTNPKVKSPVPVVAIENFLLEIGEEKWYDLGVIILNDPIKQIHLQVFTQMTPVPSEIVALAQEDTPSDYPLKWSGLSVTIGSLMAGNLQVHNSEWHHALTGIPRRDIILLAAMSLASLYKKSLG